MRGGGGYFQRWGVFVGYPADIEAAKMLYTSLLIQATRFGSAAWRDAGHSPRDYGKSRFMTGFLTGFSLRIKKRLADAQTDALDVRGTALIVQRDAAVDQAVKDMFGEVQTGKGRTVDGAGMAAGWIAGANADMGQTKVAAGAHRLGSGE